MSMHEEAGESQAPRAPHTRLLYNGIIVVIVAFGLYLLLAMLSWAAPQPGQVETSAQMSWLNSIPAFAVANKTDTYVIYMPVVRRQATPTPLPTPTPIPFPPISSGASLYSSIPVYPYLTMAVPIMHTLT